MSYQAVKRHGGTLNAYCSEKGANLEGSMLCDSNYTAFWKRQNYADSKKISSWGRETKSWSTENFLGK